MPLTLRNVKGSPLTYAEADANFSGLADLSLTTFLQSGTGAIARTVQSKARDIISLKDFGAVGDGIADDTAALAAWLVACAGKAGYAPSGTYLTTAEIAYNVAASGSISLFGDGPTTIFKASGVSNKVLHISGTAGVTISSVSLRSFAIQSATSGASSAGLHLDGIAHYFVEDVWVDGKNKMTNGIQCTGAQQGQISGGQIQNCITGGLVEKSGAVESNGIEWHGMTLLNTTTNLKVSADDIFFHGNHLTSAAMQIDAGSVSAIGMLVFSENHLEPLAGNNGMIIRSGYASVTGNSFYGIAGTTDINLSGVVVAKIIGNLITANVTIGASAADTVFAFNSTGGTITDSGTRTKAFGNRAFSGTPIAGLDYYTESAWTPIDSSGAALAFTSASGTATRVGRLVNFECELTFPVTANGTVISIGGLPYASKSTGPANPIKGGLAYSDYTTAPIQVAGGQNATTFTLFRGGSTQFINSDLSAKTIRLFGSYMTNNP